MQGLPRARVWTASVSVCRTAPILSAQPAHTQAGGVGVPIWGHPSRPPGRSRSGLQSSSSKLRGCKVTMALLSQVVSVPVLQLVLGPERKKRASGHRAERKPLGLTRTAQLTGHAPVWTGPTRATQSGIHRELPDSGLGHSGTLRSGSQHWGQKSRWGEVN